RTARDARDIPRNAAYTPLHRVYTDTRPAVQSVRPRGLWPRGQLAEPRQSIDHLPETRCGQELVRRATIARIAGAVMVDADPARRQLVEALDGVHRRALGDRGHRAAIG